MNAKLDGQTLWVCKEISVFALVWPHVTPSIQTKLITCVENRTALGYDVGRDACRVT
jgi:hypothetical protein